MIKLAENVYQHGIYIQEESTALVPMTQISAPPVVIGTAFKGPVNEPTLITSYAEFVATFGTTGVWSMFTMEEVAYAFFNLYNMTPAIFINVADPTRHKTTGTRELTGTATPFTITDTPLILSTLVVRSGTKTLTQGRDYKAEQDGLTTTITVISQTNITDDKITITYSELDATQIPAADVIGGESEVGLQVVERVYPRLGMIPGIIIAPRFSKMPEVALAMAAKCKDINGVFKSIAICDMETAQATYYGAAYNYKTTNNLVDEFLVVCWPMVGLGDKTYYLSTHVAALMCTTDATHDQIPYESPSNKRLQINRACLMDGTQVDLTKVEANVLNSYGIVTALNFAGYYRLWGNRTSIYPTSSDPKDAWIPCRRMMSWVGNTLAVNYFIRLDAPITRRLVEYVLDNVGLFLNGLVSRGALLGGKIQFLQEENPATDLADGRIKFHLSICPPAPARVIIFTLEYDVNAYAQLMS